MAAETAFVERGGRRNLKKVCYFFDDIDISQRNPPKVSRKRHAFISEHTENPKRAKNVVETSNVPTTCHHCQLARRKDVVNCCQCKKRWCEGCRNNWFTHLTRAEIINKCPFCREICNCKKCLRKHIDTKLSASCQEALYLHAHMLKEVYPFLKSFDCMQQEEKNVDGENAKVITKKLNGERSFCDRCEGAIVDIYRGCNVDDHYDLCLTCCRELRETFYGSIPCIKDNCNGNLVLHSVYEPNWVSKLTEKARELRKLAENTDSLPSYEEAVDVNVYDNLESWKKASQRESSGDNYIYFQSVQDIKSRDQYSVFKHVWRKGHPLVVRNCLEETKGLSWDPAVMMRSCRDKRKKGEEEGETASVLDCKTGEVTPIGIKDFFDGYTKGFYDSCKKPVMYKLKDWPPYSDYGERIPRHGDEFITSLPFPQYTHPNDGLLNVASAKLPKNILGPDLGPKMYIASGAKKTPGYSGSVTHLHLDVSDAVNLLAHEKEVHQHGTMEKSSGGALWDIFRREDVPKIESFLNKHHHEFKSFDKPIERVVHPIFQQSFYLEDHHKAQLKEEYGVEPWTFEQQLGESVFIPAGCPHQVKNLKSCIKIAMDFVSPESLAECMKVADGLRRIPADNPLGLDKTDKLEVMKLLLHCVNRAIHEIPSLAKKMALKLDDLLN